MKQLNELLETGIYTEYSPSKAMTVRDLLVELDLTDKIFGVVVNGRKVELDTIINEKDKVSIIPQIAGGQETPINRLKWLLDSFDKKYIKELFEEGEKVDIFNGKQQQNYQYLFEGWVYTISRKPRKNNLACLFKW